MKHQIRIPRDSAIPLFAVVHAMARSSATLGNTAFHRPTYEGVADRLLPKIIRDAKEGRLQVTDEDGFDTPFELLIQQKEGASSKKIVEHVSPDGTLYWPLLNFEWATRVLWCRSVGVKGGRSPA